MLANKGVQARLEDRVRLDSSVVDTQETPAWKVGADAAISNRKLAEAYGAPPSLLNDSSVLPIDFSLSLTDPCGQKVGSCFVPSGKPADASSWLDC